MNSCENQVSPVAVSSGPWFGSSGREKHCKTIDAIPAWKRFLLCWLSYRKWKLARACDHAAIHALKRLDDYALFDRLLRVSDAQWAEIFNLPNK